MSGRDEEFDAQLAERGDDRPGLADLDDDDFSALAASEDADDDADDDYPEDAEPDEIDLVVALYREDDTPAAMALAKELANDFDEFVGQLRRVPGEAGSVGAVIIDSDFFVIVRVRGKKVEVLLSDIVAADDWPIARDAADFLGEEVTDDEDDAGPVGDFDMFSDAGMSEFDLEQLASDLDADPADIVAEIFGKLGYGTAYAKVASGFGL